MILLDIYSLRFYFILLQFQFYHYLKYFFNVQSKNASHRQAVQNAAKQGLPIQGQQHKQTLGQTFIDEAIIISNLFDLDEFAAVELLLDG